jgi:hypothetical protein
MQVLFLCVAFRSGTVFRACLVPFSRAERCPGASRADWVADSRAGDYFFPFRAGKDTPFLRRTLSRSIPGLFGS